MIMLHHIHTLLSNRWFVRWSCCFTIFIPSTFDISIPSTSTYSLWRW
jgi:hypothetical protein